MAGKNDNWLKDMFINEAKAALDSRNNMSGSGGNAGGGGTGGNEGWIGDGNTHIWISLHEGRTSPMLGVCPNGTVTVDWGDGTTPDVLTGTSTSTVQWTPNHEYAKAGDYVITLTVDGEMSFYRSGSTNYLLQHSKSGGNNSLVYANAIRKVESGEGVTSIGEKAFQYCRALASITIPEGVTSIDSNAFAYCNSLASITIPEGVTSIGSNAFPGCSSLASITIPEGVTSIGSSAFPNCHSLASITIPEGVTSIGSNAFTNCYGVRYYDFSKHTTVPTLGATSAFTGIPADCEIRVPAALYDEWIAATNWTAYANYVKAV